MDRPDADAVRAVLPAFAWADFNYSGATLDPVVEMANAYVEAVTGRVLDASMPTELDDLALQAVALRTAQLVSMFQADSIETMTDDGIQSFSVPGYSETRRDLTSVYKNGLVNPWPLLHELLWLLMTPAKREEWQDTLNDENAPAFAITETDWGFATAWRDWEQP